jgi:hypothetical protein
MRFILSIDQNKSHKINQYQLSKRLTFKLEINNAIGEICCILNYYIVYLECLQLKVHKLVTRIFKSLPILLHLMHSYEKVPSPLNQP